MKRGKENYIKKGEKGLKNTSFRAINSKKNPRGVNDQNAQYISLGECIMQDSPVVRIRFLDIWIFKMPGEKII